MSAAGPEHRAQAASLDDLETRLQQTVQAARAQWAAAERGTPAGTRDGPADARDGPYEPAARAGHALRLAVEDADFVRYAAARLSADRSLGDALDALRLGDLYLACGCSQGDETALRLFRARYTAAMARAAARGTSPDQVDDVVQHTLGRLLVPDGDTPPRITRYAGRGQLSKWAQTVTLRAARDVSRKRRELPRDDMAQLADRIIDGGEPELAHLKVMYRAQFKAAFAHAFETLSARQRNLLKLEVCDGRTIEAIAQLYAVHPATVSRWRTATREALRSKTRTFFEQQLNVRREDFGSIMRLIGSQLDVSLPRLLQQPDPDA